MLDNTNLNYYLDSITTYLTESQARNFTRWPILGNYVWPNPGPIPTTFIGEQNELKIFLTAHIAWIDANLPGTCYSLGEFEQEKMEASLSVYPNPANGSVFISFPNLSRRSLTLDLLDLSGKKLLSQLIPSNEEFPLIELDLKSLSLETGIYLIKVQGEEVLLTKKLVVR